MSKSSKTALITGGARGLGKMTALQLASEGFQIVFSYNTSEDEAKKLIEELNNMGVKAHKVKGDITDPDDINKIADFALEKSGSIDVLINNAGPFVHERKTSSEYSMEEVRYLVNGHYLGIMQLEHKILPIMQKNKWGRIIHYGFDRAHEARGYPLRAVYAASRVALVSYTKTLAIEESPNNITVNMICIGDIRDPYKEMYIEEAHALSKERGKIVRPGTGEDVANLVSFLCEESSSFITGSIIDLTGGIDPIFQRANTLKSSLLNKKS